MTKIDGKIDGNWRLRNKTAAARRQLHVKKKITIKGKKVGNCKISVKGYNKKGKLVAKGKIKIIVKKAGTSNKTKTDDNNNTDNSNVGGKSSELEGEKPSSDTSSFDAGEYSIDKVHKGEATFYDRESTGAANLDDYESIYYTAAMNNEDYMNGLAGAYIEVTDKDGDVVNALITDRLPEGKKGDIDLSRSAFKSIEPEVTGRMDITWKIIPLPTDDPIGFLWKNTSSQYWAEVQVRNGRYPIKSVEYYDSSSKSYVALERKEYNYFAAPSGMGSGPYKFKITDFYGHIIIEDNIAINNNNEVVWGSKNFEY